MDFSLPELNIIKECLIHTENTGVAKYDISTKIYILQLVDKIEKRLKLHEISNRNPINASDNPANADAEKIE